MTTTSFPPVTLEAWTTAVEAELEGKPASALDTKLEGGVRVRPLEVTAPAAAARAERSGAVVVAPRHGHPDPESVRRAVQDDVLGGATGLFLQYSRACRFGLDADHPAALEHVVEGGTAAGTLRDLASALELGAAGGALVGLWVLPADRALASDRARGQRCRRPGQIRGRTRYAARGLSRPARLISPGPFFFFLYVKPRRTNKQTVSAAAGVLDR